MSTENISARDRILASAGKLFSAEGYRGTGVDRIIADSGVAKATFYKHFPAKDDLIVEWLAQTEASAATLLPGLDAAEPFFALTDALIALAGTPSCLGCAFQGTAAEFADHAHPAHAASIAAKRRVLAGLTQRAEAQGLAQPKSAAEIAFLLIEGVFAAVRMFGPMAPISGAKAALRNLVAEGPSVRP